MATRRVPQRSFAAGELDPRFNGLADNELYNRGMRKATGTILSEFGTVFKRWGSERIAATLGPDAQLHSMIVPGEGTKVLVMTADMIQCYDAVTRVIETTVDYSSIWDSDPVAFKQAICVPDDNEMWFFHPDNPPFILKRSAAGTWSAESILIKGAYADIQLHPRPNSTTMEFLSGNPGEATRTMTAGTPYFRKSDTNTGSGSVWFGGKDIVGNNSRKDGLHHWCVPVNGPEPTDWFST